MVVAVLVGDRLVAVFAAMVKGASALRDMCVRLELESKIHGCEILPLEWGEAGRETACFVNKLTNRARFDGVPESAELCRGEQTGLTKAARHGA